MKKKIKQLVLFATMLMMTMAVNAQWSYQTAPTSNNLYSIYFPDNTHGYAVGDRIHLLSYGVGWQGIGNSTDIFYSVHMTSADTGFMVGGTNFPLYMYYGICSKSTSGGTGFTNFYEIVDTLMSVYFTNSSIGYGAGLKGLIVKSTDGGINWTTIASGTTNDLRSVYFPDANTGYIAGLSGTILKTTNGGTSWTAQNSGTTVDLFSIYFTDINTGYAVGGNGTILKTINGGTNWTAQTSGTTNILRSVHFPSSNIGYVVGYLGTILKTFDSGINWHTVTSGTSVHLNSVYFLDNDLGYTAGNNGVILKTTNGGGIGVRFKENNLFDVMKVYPNPSNGMFTLELFGVGESQALITITDLTGRAIFNNEIEFTQHFIKEYDLTHTAKGAYIIHVSTEQGSAFEKLIVQ